MEGTTTLSAEEGGLLCQGGYAEKGEDGRMPLSKDEVAPALTPGSVPEVQQGKFGEDALPSNLHQTHAGKSDHTNCEPLIAASEVCIENFLWGGVVFLQRIAMGTPFFARSPGVFRARS